MTAAPISPSTRLYAAAAEAIRAGGGYTTKAEETFKQVLLRDPVLHRWVLIDYLRRVYIIEDKRGRKRKTKTKRRTTKRRK